MESLATPGSIVVSEHTHKLTEGYFDFKSLGPAQIKGFTEPVHIYEVSGVGPLRTKLQLSVRRGLAHFVGRQSEMEQLRHALELAKGGHGQIVGVMGEPGVGKSRLFYEFKLLSQSGCLVLETFSVSHGKAYPYLPLIDLLKNYFQLGLHDDERLRREKITGRVLTLDRGLEDILPYLFFLLGVAEPTSPLQQMDPQIRRRRILDAIKRLLLRESLNQPLIIVFEDLHWLDAETQAFLSLLSESIPTARILLLVNYRPEYRHEWGSKGYYTQLRLDPLGREQAEEMLTVLLGNVGAQHAVPLRQFILDKTEGNPFFMEEIVQALREQRMLTDGTGSRTLLPQDIRLPTTVQGVLASRMDRLPPDEKGLLQTLAVIGREFSSSLLKKVVEQPEAELYGQLAHLQAAEFIYEQPAFPETEYIFKHALTQEVAYNSLLQERRKVLYERTARAIEEVYRSKLDDHYSTLAHHYSRSGNTQKAVDYLYLAGQQAVQRSANEEAINHLMTALELLKALPDRPERAQQELTLQIAIGAPLQATKGWAAPEMGTAYGRAQELCRQLGEVPQLFMVLWGAWQFYVVRGEYNTSRQLAERLLSVAQQQQKSSFLVQAHYAIGLTLVFLGEFHSARLHFEQTITLYEPQQHRSHTTLYGYDPQMGAFYFLGWTLWYLGYSDQALKKIHEALQLAQKLSHPFSLASALLTALWVHQERRESRAALEKAEALITLCKEEGFMLFLAWGNIIEGWALIEEGQLEEGITRMYEGVVSHRTTGAEMQETKFLTYLGEAHGKAGRSETALTFIAEALAEVHRTGERFYEAELYRLKGELTPQRESGVRGPKSEVINPQHPTPSSQAEAEECFLKAIEISRKQQAKSLELRAATSLARLWREQGRRDEAHKMLFDVYNWFTEGFDTKDLQEAKALLEELSQ